MSDLIHREALLGGKSKRYDEKVNIMPDNLAEGFVQMEKLIKEHPIAYDLESVIVQLEEELRKCAEYHKQYGNCGNQIYAYKNALEIVKSGIHRKECKR